MTNNADETTEGEIKLGPFRKANRPFLRGLVCGAQSPASASFLCIRPWKPRDELACIARKSALSSENDSTTTMKAQKESEKESDGGRGAHAGDNKGRAGCFWAYDTYR